MARRAYEYGEVVIYRAPEEPADSIDDWVIHTFWYGPPVGDPVDLTDGGQNVIEVLIMLGREGWSLMGPPETESATVYKLPSKGKNGTDYQSNVSTWVAKRWWLKREVNAER